MNMLESANNLLNEGFNKSDEVLINKAENLYNDILLKFPKHPDANHNLGMIYIKRNLYSKALPYFNESCEAESPHAQFFISRSSCKYRLKDTKGSLNDINKAEEIDSENIKVIKMKGILLRILGDEENAFTYLLKYYNLNPNDAEGLNRLALHYLIKESHTEAKKYLKKAIEINPNYYEAIVNYANSCLKTNDRNEAKKNFEKALVINPKEPIIHLNYGTYFQEANKHEEALKHYNKCIELGGKNVQILHNIGTAYGELGSKKAAEFYKEVLELKPDHYISFRSLCNTRTLKEDDRILESMEKKFYDDSIPDSDKSEIGHGLSVAYDYLKLYNKASEFMHLSNKYWRATFDYDINKDASLGKRIIENFTEEEFKKIPQADNDQHTPIFILGMPRSGTSLVEQILANIPKLDICGELNYFPLIVRDHISNLKTKNESKYPEAIKNINKDLINNIQRMYLSYVSQFTEKESKIFTDKMPYNFWHIGLIKKAFPNSKIIICNRDLRDVTTSLYVQKLSGGHPFSFNQKELTLYTNNFYNLTSHWINLLKKDLYIFDYEEFIDNQEKKGKDLFKYLNLKFKKEYLETEKNQTAVRTASNYQVKDKINSSSIGRWKNYKNELNGIFNNLNGFKL